MGAETGISWTDSTWNPVRGCSRISPGCEHCYAEVMAGRFSGPGLWGNGFALKVAGKEAHWTRKVALVPDKLDLPLTWKKPRRIFVNSTSDLFHESLSPLDIGKVFEVMERCPQHTFQILTKRAHVMREYMQIEYATKPPPKNVWLGVSVEDQTYFNVRATHLRRTPAAVRFLSCEPLLGPVEMGTLLRGIGWVIVGGESGSGARSMRLEWAHSIVKQCKAEGVAVFIKQLGVRPTFRNGVGVPVNETGPVVAFPVSDSHGSAIEEFPADLQVREFPEPRRG